MIDRKNTIFTEDAIKWLTEHMNDTYTHDKEVKSLETLLVSWYNAGVSDGRNVRAEF